MGVVADEKERSLESTATWAVAVVCFVVIAISTVIDKFIHRFESWLRKKRNPSLREAHEKIKTERCRKQSIDHEEIQNPARFKKEKKKTLTRAKSPNRNTLKSEPESSDLVDDVGNERLHVQLLQRRKGPLYVKQTDENLAAFLANLEAAPPRFLRIDYHGKVQLVSAYGINQLHIFILVLAVSHVICCAATLGLGSLKIRKWKSWEEETNTVQYQCYNDPERFRLARETTFARRHSHCWTNHPILLWIGCFFGQFFTSVAKVDYLTLRHGFITAHLPPQSRAKFNFQKYINRSLEEDFKVLVGIRPVIWLPAVLFLLANTNGWYSQFWLPFIPLIGILLIGTEFQVIITKMGISILERGDVIKGTPMVQPGDNLFWFSRPRLILFLIHFVLFENAFQIAFFTWSWYEFGFPSCYHENVEEMIIRITTGVTIQVLCSYVTLPLYALVTQMGSSVKPAIFSQRVTSSLRAWHLIASKRLKQRQQSGSTTPVDGGASPVHLLRGHNNYDEINEGMDGFGEGTSESPSYRDLDLTVRRKSRPLGQIKRGECEISLQSFSFGNKQGLAGMSGSTSAFPSHRDIDDTVRDSRPPGQIERDDIEISSKDFSF
ncbi:hypothetical protein C2S51_033122 [Perilla frutescens var. frutescens]|nr:hypothetical protein C2S51_033122 [Perilla frutescens var. frutescens]